MAWYNIYTERLPQLWSPVFTTCETTISFPLFTIQQTILLCCERPSSQEGMKTSISGER